MGDRRRPTTPAPAQNLRELRKVVEGECARRGQRIDLSVLSAHTAACMATGDQFLRLRLPELLSADGTAGAEALPFESNLEAVAGNGLFVGHALYATLSPLGRHREPCATACALWNLLVRCFDNICDEHASLRTRLYEVISAAALDRALDARVPAQTAPAFRSSPDDDPRVARVAQLAEALFRHLRSVRADHLPTWLALQEAVFDVYRAQQESMELRLSATLDLGRAHRILRGKSSLPSWVAALMVLVTEDDGPDPSALRDTMLSVGDLYWLADDIMDLEEDLLAGQMNCVALAAAQRGDAAHLKTLAGMSPDALHALLLDQGHVQAAMRLLFDTHDEVSARLDHRFGPRSTLQQALFPGFSCWFTPLFV